MALRHLFLIFALLTIWPKPPADVPAIKEPMESECDYVTIPGGVPDALGWLCTNHGEPPDDKSTPLFTPLNTVKKGTNGYRWTCADKSRILLTDEAGNRHCFKIQ